MPDEIYYGLPLKFSDIFKKKELKKVNVFDSIIFNIRLILTSNFGENRFDRSFGCAIWEKDFEITYSDNVWKEELSASIRDTFSIHEKRLLNIKVEAQIGEQEFKTGKGATAIHRIKRKIDLRISGNFYLTGEEFRCREVLYISPLSVEQPN
jgi:phage baseplate assembly protein W